MNPPVELLVFFIEKPLLKKKKVKMEEIDDCLLHLVLPNEILSEIFSFAAPRDCLRIILRLVCKKWNQLARLKSYKWSEAVPELLSCEDLLVETTKYCNTTPLFLMEMNPTTYTDCIGDNPCHEFRRTLKYPPHRSPFPLGAICDAACEGELKLCEYLLELDPILAYWANSFLYYAVANGHRKIMDWSEKLGASFGARVVCVAALGGYADSYTYSLARCSPDQLFTKKKTLDFGIQDRIYVCIALGGILPMDKYVWSNLEFFKVIERPINERKVIVSVMLYGQMNAFASLFIKFVCDEYSEWEDPGGHLLESAMDTNIAILCKCVLDIGVKIPEHILENMAVLENVDILKVFQDQIKKDWTEEQSKKEEE